MSGERPILVYRRSGGRDPADDERLDLAADGRFDARRTVGGRRIGRFSGRLGDAQLSSLQAMSGAAAAAGDFFVATPMDGATVSLIAGDREARFGSNEALEGAWGELVTAVTGLLDGDVLAAPVAALELEATSSQARLRHVGNEPLEVDRGSMSVRAVRLDAQGLVLGRWQGTTTPPQVEDGLATGTSDWQAADEGWQLELPFRHGLELTRDDWLQVWVTVAMRDAGEPRDGRLFVAVPGAGS